MRLSFGRLGCVVRRSARSTLLPSMRLQHPTALHRTLATDATAATATAPAADAKAKAAAVPEPTAADRSKPFATAPAEVTAQQWSALKAQNEKLYDQVDLNLDTLQFSEFFPDVWSANNQQHNPLKKALRQLIAKHTKQILKTPTYHTTASPTSTELVRVSLSEPLLFHSRFTAKRMERTHTIRVPHFDTPTPSDVRVLNAAPIETAYDLKRAGFNPLIMMPTGATAGGAWERGTVAAGAEEEMWRRTSLSRIIRPKDFPLTTGGGLYAPDAIVFRGGVSTGYRLLAEPYTQAFAAFEQIRHPTNILHRDGTWIMPQVYVNKIKLKFRSFLRMAKHYSHDAVVIPAFGSGSFKNPTRHVASIWKSVFEEAEFANQLPAVRFAITDDFAQRPNWQPDGTLRPYLEVFAADPNHSTGYVPPAQLQQPN